MSKPGFKVSVAIITYNQEPFIAEAMDSVLGQKTDFPVQVVVGNDCSPDGTGEILRQYEKDHPDQVCHLDHKDNLGAGRNFLSVMDACEGEYIALLDGDDYWTDPNKLARQVAMLDADPSLTMSFHPVRTKHEGSEQEESVDYPPGRKPVYTFEDLTKSYLAHTSAVVYRHGIFGPFPDWYLESPVGDWPLQLLVAEHGNLGYIDDVMSTYRIHAGGEWHGRRSDRRKGLEDAVRMRQLLIDRHFKGEHARHLARSMQKRAFQLVQAHADAGDLKAARETLRECMGRGWYDPKVDPLEPMRSMAQVYAPWVYGPLRALGRSIRGKA